MKSITAKRALRTGRRRVLPRALGDRSDVVRRSPQTLIPSSPSTTSSGSKAPAAGRTWCSPPRKPLLLRRRTPRLPGPRRRCWGGRGASLPANPYSFVAEHHVFRIKGAGGGPDVVRRSPQTLILSSPGTTSSGSKAPTAGRTWCVAPRKSLFLRRRAPRLPNQRRRRRAGRGASLPTNPYSFVAEHHVFRGQAPATSRTWCAAPRKPLFLRRRAPRLPGQRRRRRAGRGAPLPAIPSSPGTTSSGSKAPAAGRTWCSPPRKPLFFRHRAPRLPGPRCRCWRGPTVEYGFAGSQAPTWPAVGRNESETWCKGNGGSRLCGNSCTKSPPAPRREIPFFHF